MSMEYDQFYPEEQSSLWEVQQELVHEYRELESSGAVEAVLLAKADQINRIVAELVDMGEVEPEDAWALSAGDNPYLQEKA